LDIQSAQFETRQIHAGVTPDPVTGARALPIQQTTSFVFPDAEAAARRFGLEEIAPIYSRIGNPTVQAVEDKVAALEGGVGALAVGSGQAATSLALLNLAEGGGHIVASPSLYGGTQNLFKHTLPKLGIEVTFVEDPDDVASWLAAVQPNTAAFFAETVANPRTDVLDVESVASAAHEVGVPLVVDNTLATPYLSRPIEFGADVVVHSATKFLGGHGTAIAGVIVDAGTFDYSQHPDRFPGFNTPDESYHGLVFGKDRSGGDLRGQPVLHPESTGAAAAGPGPQPVPAQRLRDQPGPGDAESARGAPRAQCHRGGPLPAGPPGGAAGLLLRTARKPLL